VFDHRGCKRGVGDKEYTGPKAGTKDDQMCIKVQFSKVVGLNADEVLRETLAVLKK